MLDWLRILLGAPAVPQINISENAIAIAFPGDLVLLAVPGIIPAEHLDAYCDRIAELVKKHGVQIVVVDNDTKITVVKSGRQQ